MDLEQEIRAYAGHDYAKPREVREGELLFEDYSESIDTLIKALIDFREQHKDCGFRPRERDDEYGCYVDGFEAIRYETPDEVAERIEEYRLYAERKRDERRAQYERLKREFGD